MKIITVIAIGLLFVKCETFDNSVNTDERLVLLASYNLNVPEPSGLALNTEATALYVVSDPDDNKVRKISLTGQVLETLSYNGDDIEGITVDSDESLWIVEERLREIVHLDQTGVELNRYNVDFQGDENTGFEGITIGHSGNVFVLNEKNPGVVLELMGSEIENNLELNSAKDYSGICYNSINEQYYIVSDESSQLMIFDTEFTLLDTYAIGVSKVEGVDYDSNLNRLYIVSDSDETLYVYELEL